MGEFFKGWRRQAGCATQVMMGIALFVAAISLQQRSEVLSRHTSPNGKWNISEEYEWKPSRFRIILRDSTGKEIASGNEFVIESYLIDLPSDFASKLEITDDTAGTKGHPMWQLDAAHNTWYVVPSSESP